jgi:beta-xylosidase
MPEFTWTNPIIDAYLADPFMIHHDGRYWLIATGQARDGRHLPIWTSIDLVNWTFVRGAVARGKEGSWNRFNFWAPEVLHHDGRWWLYYTAKPTDDKDNAGNRVGLAVADTPDGPYEDVGVIVDHASLDGSPFRDHDGQLWLFYVTDHGNKRGIPPGKIWVDRLVSPTQVADAPTCLIDEHGWQEGPVLMAQPDGRYRLTYSLGGWTNDTYRVAQAVGDHPAGPFVEDPDAIIMRSNDKVKGPGHHNFFTGPDGKPWLIYHGWDPGMKARYPRIDPLRIAADGTWSSVAPTSTAQSYHW